MFWSPALYSGTYFQTSVAINSLFQASLRKQGEFILVPQLRLLSWKASQKKATHRTVCSTFFQQSRKSCRVLGVFLVEIFHLFVLGLVFFAFFFFRQLESNSICKGSKILYISLDSVPELLDFLFLFVFKIHRANKTLD